MRVISCQLENFASYKKIDFTFDNQGLVLIHGPTGSGKSTLCDAIPWVLFGVTAKGGKVDEVLSWPGISITKGIITLDNGFKITRIRGPKAKDNDLFLGKEAQQRGKDIPDTQRLINALLGMDADLYLSGAYYHEFSKTASFFTTTAKARKELCEQLVDLSLAKRLQIKVSEAKKATAIELSKVDRKRERAESRIELLTERVEVLKHSISVWDTQQTNKIAALTSNFNNFEENKKNHIISEEQELLVLQAEIQPSESFYNRKMALRTEMSETETEVCDKCGASKHNSRRDELRQALHELDKESIRNDNRIRQKENLIRNIETIKLSVNTYGEELQAAKNADNPYIIERIETKIFIKKHTHEIKSFNEAAITQTLVLEDLDLLSDVVNDFRGVRVKSTISDLQNKTNALLSKHFDAEIRVEFGIPEADKLEVTITKDGNTCVYSQLSKGQRQLLKLCFGVSVMGVVANHHGLSFNAAFIDEGFDGLSDEFKVKAYGLLQTLALEYDSLFVVEHSSELKAMFPKQFEVSLTENGSVIEEA